MSNDTIPTHEDVCYVRADSVSSTTDTQPACIEKENDCMLYVSPIASSLIVTDSSALRERSRQYVSASHEVYNS